MAESGELMDGLVCPGCAYNLFGISQSTRCPECGLEIDRGALAVSVLPWAHRKGIGNVRAFFKTALLGTFRPLKIAGEMNRPVSYPDAQRFRHACILSVWVPVMIALAVYACIGETLNMPVWQRIIFWGLIGLAIWLFLLAVTGLPSLFFHPRGLPTRRQNRAIALSYYVSSAPLAWWWIPVVVGVIGLWLPDRFPRTALEQAGLVGLILGVYLIPLSLVVLSIWGIVRLMRRATNCSLVRVWCLALMLPVMWVALTAIILVGIPAFGLLIGMVLSSFS